MTPKNNILKQFYYPLKIANSIGNYFGMASSNSLRALIYHDIGPKEHDKLRKQLEWLSDSWRIISPDQFSLMISGQEKIEGRNLLITFDDGLLSNRLIAEKILNPLGIRALFFCVSDLIAIEDEEEAKIFIKNRICLSASDTKLPSHWKNMNWEDLSALLEQGHLVGAHTKSHARLSEISDIGELTSEIIESADVISKRLGVDIEHFAYPFGDINSMNQIAMNIAKSRFKYIHSGIRGINSLGNYGIYRDAVAEQDSDMNYHVYPQSLLGAFLEGAADWHYRSKRGQLQKWYQGKLR